MTKTSFHINGFWFHVSWNFRGTMGIDQHGDTWYNKANPTSAAGGLSVSKRPQGATKAASSKDLFMFERERSNAIYINRQLGLR